MAEASQSIQEIGNEAGQFSEQIAEQVITQGHQEQVNNDIPTRTAQMLRRLMDGGYTYDSVVEGVKGAEIPREMKSAVYGLWGKEIIRLLNEDIAKKRMMSSRERHASARKAKEESTGNSKKGSRAKAKQAEEEAAEEVSIQKMTLDEIGRELSQQEEQEKEKRAEREKLDQEIQAERARHAKAYQYAFEMFSLSVAMSSDEDISRLVDLIRKLGNENFGVRQSAIENLVNEPKIVYAFDALEAALQDKIIVHKTIQAIARTGEFRAVETLLSIIRDSSGAKESTVRGLAEQAVGEILLIMNREKKGSGLKSLYTLLKSPKYEKNLLILISILSRDIESTQMRKFYLSKQCLKMMLLIGNKLVKNKKKKMKVTFVTVSLNTPLTKEINGVLKTIQDVLKAA